MEDIRDFLKRMKVEEERGIRIFEEFVSAHQKLTEQSINNTIVMFGSARIKDDDKMMSHKYYKSCRELARMLATWSKERFKNRPDSEKYYICTGGGGGIMEAANRGAHDAGEKSVGFNILLPFEQEANPYITPELILNFHYFFIRKFYFAYLAKAFVVFPGGFGTFDELYEILTLAQTRKMQKTAPFVLFGKEFFEKTLDFDLLLEHGFISAEDKKLFITTDSLTEAFNHITSNIEDAHTVVGC